MFLEQIKKYGSMRSPMNILKLVARKFCHNKGLLIELWNDIKQRYSHIACHYRVGVATLHNGGKQIGGGTFPFGACNAKRLRSIRLQEKVGLRSNSIERTHSFKNKRRNAWRFNDEVVAFGNLRKNCIISFCNSHFSIWQQFFNETMTAFAFTSVACQKDAFIL